MVISYSQLHFSWSQRYQQAASNRGEAVVYPAEEHHIYLAHPLVPLPRVIHHLQAPLYQARLPPALARLPTATVPVHPPADIATHRVAGMAGVMKATR